MVLDLSKGKIDLIRTAGFAAITLGCIFGGLNPGVALLLGFLTNFLAITPRPESVYRVGKLLIAWAIVGYGLTVHIGAVLSMTVSHCLVTIICIGSCLIFGRLFAKPFSVSRSLSALISSGTSICGASAIAAVGNTIRASVEEISMSLGVVFIFNSIALFLFPYLGTLLHLTATQFGVWAGLAIHDTSSVIGAALLFDPASVEVATTVKLARAIWIAPLCIYFAGAHKDSGTKNFFKLTPWFIWGYLASALAGSLITPPLIFTEGVAIVARGMFVSGVFFIGATTKLKNLRSLGAKPFLLGLLLWCISGVIGLIYCLQFVPGRTP